MGLIGNLLRMGMIGGASAIPGVGPFIAPILGGALYGPEAGLGMAMGNLGNKKQEEQPRPQGVIPSGIPGVQMPSVAPQPPQMLNIQDLLLSNPQLLSMLMRFGGGR